MNPTIEFIARLSVVLCLWGGPLLTAAWLFRRKGYSPHWAWCGLIPPLGWLVLLVAVVLRKRSRTVGDAPGQQTAAVPIGPAERYQRGMRDLGSGLIAMAIWQCLMIGVALGVEGPVPWIMWLFGALVLPHLVLGLLAIKRQAWVNYAVVVWGGLIVVVDLMGIAKLGQTGRAASLGASLGGCFGFLWAGALLLKSINNIQYHHQANIGRPGE
jgi:hypothetical protein